MDVTALFSMSHSLRKILLPLRCVVSAWLSGFAPDRVAAKIGLVTVLILITAVSVLRLSDCFLCGSQASAFIGPMIVHFTYDALFGFLM